MQYKTIVLRLLEERPEMYEQLRKQRMLLATMERFAVVLKTSHETWKKVLSQRNPCSDASQVASAALELALKDLMEVLPPESPENEDGTLSLDEAMAFINRTPPA